MRSLQTRQANRGRPRWKGLLCFLLLGTLMSGCELWSLERGIRQVGRGIQDAEVLGMEEAALYHLNVARRLLEAAEKQYEEADFPTATQFLDQSERQLAMARRLHAMYQSKPRLRYGVEE